MSSSQKQVLFQGDLVKVEDGPFVWTSKPFQLPPKSCEHVLFAKAKDTEGAALVEFQHSPNGKDWFTIPFEPVGDMVMVDSPCHVARDVRLKITMEADFKKIGYLEAAILFRA